MASFTVHKPNKHIHRKVYKWNPNLNDMIYVNIADFINKYKYRLIDIPDNTAEVSEYELSPYKVGPIRNPYPNEVSSGMFTINWMINAYHNRIPFTFDRASDICHAAWKLSEYIYYLSESINTLNDDAKAYLEKAQVFLAVLDKSAIRVLRKHGKEKLVREQMGMDFLDDLISSYKNTNMYPTVSSNTNDDSIARKYADMLADRYKDKEYT